MIAGDEMRFVTEKIGHGSRSMKPAQAEERVKGRLWGAVASAVLLPVAALAIRNDDDALEDALPADPALNGARDPASTGADLPNPGFASMDSVLAEPVSVEPAAEKMPRVAHRAVEEVSGHNVMKPRRRAGRKPAVVKAEAISLMDEAEAVVAVAPSVAKVNGVPAGDAYPDTDGAVLSDVGDAEPDEVVSDLSRAEGEQAMFDSSDEDDSELALAEDGGFLAIAMDDLPCPAFGLEQAGQ